MSYDLALCDPVTKEPIRLESPHHMLGGTYQIGGCLTAKLNVTHNYGRHYMRVFGSPEGVRSIYGLVGSDSIPILEKAISQLGDDVSNDYWEPTEGNAKQALKHLLALAKLCPAGVWVGD